MPSWLLWLSQFSIIAYAVLGGVFLAFSDFIMRSLTRAEGGAEAMQIINREVFRYVFIPLFLAMAPISIGYGIGAYLYAPDNARALMITAAAVYSIGAFMVTIAGNVPLNEALDKMDTNRAETQSYWLQTYAPRWTFWNSVRTAACVIAAVLSLFALVAALGPAN